MTREEIEILWPVACRVVSKRRSKTDSVVGMPFALGGAWLGINVANFFGISGGWIFWTLTGAGFLAGGFLVFCGLSFFVMLQIVKEDWWQQASAEMYEEEAEYDDDPEEADDEYEARREPRRRLDDIQVEDALEIFGLEQNYSAAELKGRYRALQKKVHPDVGGSAVFSRQLNQAYDMLLKRAEARR